MVWGAQTCDHIVSNLVTIIQLRYDVWKLHAMNCLKFCDWDMAYNWMFNLTCLGEISIMHEQIMSYVKMHYIKRLILWIIKTLMLGFML